MTNRAKILAQRRAMLTTECALQRITLLGQAQSLGQMGSWVSTGNHLVEHLKKLPGWASAALIGLVVFVPKRAVAIAKNSLLVWQICRLFWAKSGEQ